jgi:hypothetical protein
MTQNEWEQPKLIVLGRGRPEEHVLNGCKHPSWPGGGAGGTDKCGVPGVPCFSNAKS